MSRLISIDEIEPGMVLKKSIKNNFGQILLSEDVCLTTKHILILKTWNILSVYIESDDNEQIVEFSDEDFIAAKTKLKERFIWDPRNENENDLFKLGMIDYLRKHKI